MKIEVVKADITKLQTDAIVNAANETLLGGGGVDGAIHEAAGPELLTECKTLGGCKPGEAKATSGYLLPARYIIHTVGPVWQGGDAGEEVLLRNCYINCMVLAEKMKLSTIAFPNISTGVYGFPKYAAAKTAIDSVREYGGKNTSIERVVFCVYNDENYRIYNELLTEKTNE